GTLDLTTAAERDAVLRAGAGPARTEPYRGVVERIRTMAAERADTVAVRDDHGELTYAALVGRASALSRRLTGTGLVAVLSAPGTDFVVATLGVLGAGRAFLPLDSGAPV